MKKAWNFIGKTVSLYTTIHRAIFKRLHNHCNLSKHMKENLPLQTALFCFVSKFCFGRNGLTLHENLHEFNIYVIIHLSYMIKNIETVTIKLLFDLWLCLLASHEGNKLNIFHFPMVMVTSAEAFSRNRRRSRPKGDVSTITSPNVFTFFSSEGRYV